MPTLITPAAVIDGLMRRASCFSYSPSVPCLLSSVLRPRLGPGSDILLSTFSANRIRDPRPETWSPNTVLCFIAARKPGQILIPFRHSMSNFRQQLGQLNRLGRSCPLLKRLLDGMKRAVRIARLRESCQDANNPNQDRIEEETAPEACPKRPKKMPDTSSSVEHQTK